MTTEKTYSQADLDKIISAADERIAAMDAKVQEALDEAKKAKAEARALKEIDPADLEKLEAENERLKGELSKAQKEAKDAAKLAETATKQLEAESGFTTKLLTENALNSALADAGVKEPAMLKAVKAMMAGTAQVVTDGADRVVKIGDKALTDHIKEWAGTDEAKHFISAVGSSGGGAPGGKSAASGGKTMTRTEYNQRVISDPAGIKSFLSDGGKVVNEAA